MLHWFSLVSVSIGKYFEIRVFETYESDNHENGIFYNSETIYESDKRFSIGGIMEQRGGFKCHSQII